MAESTIKFRVHVRWWVAPLIRAYCCWIVLTRTKVEDPRTRRLSSFILDRGVRVVRDDIRGVAAEGLMSVARKLTKGAE
jgi:hypothetical protein